MTIVSVLHFIAKKPASCDGCYMSEYGSQNIVSSAKKKALCILLRVTPYQMLTLVLSILSL